MDVVTYALLKKLIDAVGGDVTALQTAVSDLTPGFTYQGTADSAAGLPETAAGGDLYIVGGTDLYVYDGTAWVSLSITSAEIDTLFA